VVKNCCVWQPGLLHFPQFFGGANSNGGNILKSLKEILSPFDSERLAEWFYDLTVLWHDAVPIEPVERFTPKGMTQWVHYQNYILWHEEDEVRRKDLPDAEIVRCKRAIDRNNQVRSESIEQIDIWIDSVLKTAGINPAGDAEINSESPGSIIDRLSILSLKIFHMEEETRRKDVGDEHIKESSARLSILREQRSDLAKALDVLFLDLMAGKKRHKVYRQMKMYNDPRFNPAIYKNKESKKR
jgi:hypothetical protein